MIRTRNHLSNELQDRFMLGPRGSMYSHWDDFDRIPLRSGLANPGGTYDQSALRIAMSSNPDWMTQGANSVNATTVHEGTTGGVRLSTGTANGDEAIIHPRPTESNAFWSLLAPSINVMRTELDPVMETKILLPSLSNTVAIAGFSISASATIGGGDTDKALLRFIGTALEIHTSNNGVHHPTITVPDFTVAANTEYAVRVVLFGLVPQFYVNGRHVGTGLPLRSTPIRPSVGLRTITSASRSLVVRHIGYRFRRPT